MLNQMMKQRTDDTIPLQLGNYKILSQIGKGGMGDIYKALQEPLNRIVALKVLPPKLSRDTEFAKRFEIEAKAISLLQHQNIVSIYEYGEEDGLRYFAMQFVDGTDLGRRIAENKLIPINEIIDYTKQIGRALRYAHGANIIHRDIKPGNVLIEKNGVVRLSDFGIAKIFSGTNITMTGSAVGTPEYMSPEQAQGNKLDAQTDIYSLGIVIYEMLTRRPPFLGNNPMSVAYKQVHEQPDPPSIKRKDTPRRLEMVVLKALKKDKKERYSTVEEMLEHLDTVDTEETTPSTPGRKTPRPVQVSSSDYDRRITDRRSRERRYSKYTVFSSVYWADMIGEQWPLWLLTSALGVAFVLHLIFQH
ncbi:MAG: serine/threonine protein kinase [Chitinispirillaceae bacterium]|nr:serine/threonine protein kinase [Chitinispirillaceae bacterium]